MRIHVGKVNEAAVFVHCWRKTLFLLWFLTGVFLCKSFYYSACVLLRGFPVSVNKSHVMLLGKFCLLEQMMNGPNDLYQFYQFCKSKYLKIWKKSKTRVTKRENTKEISLIWKTYLLILRNQFCEIMFIFLFRISPEFLRKINCLIAILGQCF